VDCVPTIARINSPPIRINLNRKPAAVAAFLNALKRDIYNAPLIVEGVIQGFMDDFLPRGAIARPPSAQVKIDVTSYPTHDMISVSIAMPLGRQENGRLLRVSLASV